MAVGPPLALLSRSRARAVAAVATATATATAATALPTPSVQRGTWSVGRSVGRPRAPVVDTSVRACLDRASSVPPKQCQSCVASPGIADARCQTGARGCGRRDVYISVLPALARVVASLVVNLTRARLCVM